MARVKISTLWLVYPIIGLHLPHSRPRIFSRVVTVIYSQPARLSVALCSFWIAADRASITLLLSHTLILAKADSIFGLESQITRSVARPDRAKARRDRASAVRNAGARGSASRAARGTIRLRRLSAPRMTARTHIDDSSRPPKYRLLTGSQLPSDLY